MPSSRSTRFPVSGAPADGYFSLFRHHAPERDGVGKHKRERDKQNRQHHRDPVCREGIENLRQGNLKQFHTADGAVAAVQPKVREARCHVENQVHGRARTNCAAPLPPASIMTGTEIRFRFQEASRAAMTA